MHRRTMPTLASWVKHRSPCTPPAQGSTNCFTKHMKGSPGAQARSERHGSSGVGLGRKQHIKIITVAKLLRLHMLFSSLPRQQLVQHRPHKPLTQARQAGCGLPRSCRHLC